MTQSTPLSALSAIRAIDYTVIFVRDMEAMRSFYQNVMGFPFVRALSPTCFEYRIGANILALAIPKLIADDEPTPSGSASLQLAFKIPAENLDLCAAELKEHGLEIVSPPTDREFGHRTLFFRDPAGNLLEVYAEI